MRLSFNPNGIVSQRVDRSGPLAKARKRLARWIWNIVEGPFVGAMQELDFYHASEHLWDVARDLYAIPSP